MVGSLNEEYRAWNDAIAEVLFPELVEPVPVYLDLDEQPVAELANRMQIDASAVLPSLWSVVARTLDLSRGAAKVFGRYETALWTYSHQRSRSAEPPPHLALLACFSMAAEEMGRDDAITNANNYYGRLARGFAISDPTLLGMAYRKCAESLWEELNKWLVRLDGQRGLPTAYSVEPRFVGLAISQALVRRTDRERLITFFASRNLAPGAHVSGFSIQGLLDEWLLTKDCEASRSLKNLWKREANRERLCDIVALELANWDGRAADRKLLKGAGDLGQRIRLSAQLGGIFSRALTLSALVYVSEANTEREATLETVGGGRKVFLTRAIPGALQVGDFGQMDAGSLVGGTMTVHDSLTARTIQRQPRKLVVFRRDEVTDRMIEADQTMLGDDCWLLVKGESVRKTELLLSRIAREGWRQAQVKDVPEGWVLFTDVQILSAPPEELLPSTKISEYAALVPATTSQLSLSQGLSLPGSRRNQWHATAAPEIIAVSDHGGGFSIELHAMNIAEGGHRVIGQWADGGTGVVQASLADLELEPGDYRVVMLGNRKTLASRPLALRTGDEVDERQWERTEHVEHSGQVPITALLVDSDTSGTEAYVQGAIAQALPDSRLEVTELAAAPWWGQGRSGDKSRRRIKLGIPDENACVWTGAHNTVIEDGVVDERGRPLSKWTTGRCTQCGLVRRFPTSAAGARRKEIRRIAVNDLSALPPVPEGDIAPWETVWDALSYTGGGPWSSFERLAMHIERTPLAVDRVARNLQSLGHLDYVLDPKTLAPSRWEVGPTSLVPCGAKWYMAGHWPTGLFNQLWDIVNDLGGEIVTEANEEGPSSFFVEGVDETRLRAAVADSELPAEFSGGWESLLLSLPSLSTVLDGLPRLRAPSDAGQLTRWDVDNARWLTVRNMAEPGAYRLSQYRTTDYLRTPADVANGTVAVSNVYFSKHAAAFMQGRAPYLAWGPRNQVLAVPKGADLPGLYSRAVVMASGRLPLLDQRQRLLAYPLVPEALAQHLAHLLSH